MNSVIEAILKINPKAQVSVSNNDISTIVWENGTTPIPLADIQAKIPEVEVEYIVKQAERNRKSAYQFEADPLFFKAQRNEATMEDWQAKVAEIKARFPKG